MAALDAFSDRLDGLAAPQGGQLLPMEHPQDPPPGRRPYPPQHHGYSEVLVRQYPYPGRLGALGSLFVLLAVVVTIALTAWIFLWHAVSHGLTQEGAANSAVRLFAYIAVVAIFDCAMLRSAKLVSQPKHHHCHCPDHQDHHPHAG